MTTTIGEANRTGHSLGPPRSREADRFGRSQRRVSRGGIAHDPDVAIEATSPAAAFVAGAKSIVPVLLALIPLLLYANGSLEVSLGNERLLAGLAAVLIAWRTRSVPLTLAGGMVTL